MPHGDPHAHVRRDKNDVAEGSDRRAATPHTATRRRCAGTARDINAMRTATSAAFVPLRERSHDSIITWPAAPAPKNPVS